MTVGLYVKIISKEGHTVRLSLSEATELRDWLNTTLPSIKYPAKKA